jgi:ABC-2 type transport system permease protein
MSHSLFWDLVRKDLALYRSIVLATLAVGAMAALMVTQGGILFYLGCVTVICAFVILSILLVQFGIVMERKNHVHLFVLSLPISGRQYLLAKMLALAMAFMAPFVLTSGAALWLFGSHPPSRGFLPFATTVLLYFPMFFAVLLSVAAATRGEGPYLATVTFFSIGINLVILGLLRIPAVSATIDGSRAVWTPELLWVLSLELAISVAVPALTLWRQHQRTDYL